jgi:opine dehydrogenase
MMTEQTIKTIAVLGAGSSGQAMAGFLATAGYRVRLWNRADENEVRQWLAPIARGKTITLRGAVEGVAEIQLATSDLGTAVADADVILVNTTADAHRELGGQLAAVVDESQAIIVMSAGTFGAVDLWRGLAQGGFSGDILVGETSTTLFGSQAAGEGVVHISGRKRRVEIASLPAGRGDELVTLIPEIPFVAVSDVLETGLNNVGPSLHVAPMVLNAGWVEAQGGTYRYYRDGITKSVADVAQRVDDERVAVAAAFGKHPTTLSDYLVNSVAAPSGTLYESINGCEMYADVLSPQQLNHRFLWEDVLAGALPMATLARLAGVPAPTLSALVTLAGALLGEDFEQRGRTESNLGLSGRDVEGIKQLVTDADAFDGWKRELAAKPETSFALRL